jgi:hypothetical protein
MVVVLADTWVGPVETCNGSDGVCAPTTINNGQPLAAFELVEKLRPFCNNGEPSRQPWSSAEQADNVPTGLIIAMRTAEASHRGTESNIASSGRVFLGSYSLRHLF